MQVLTTTQQIQFLVVCPGPFVLRQIGAEIGRIRVLIFVPDMGAGAVVGQVFLMLRSVMLPDRIGIALGDLTELLGKGGEGRGLVAIGLFLRNNIRRGGSIRPLLCQGFLAPQKKLRLRPEYEQE